MGDIVVESDPESSIDNLVVGTRLYVVRVFDPDQNLIVAGATVLGPDRMKEIDTLCEKYEIPYTDGLHEAAAAQVVGRMWNGNPPGEHDVESVTEVSERELRNIIELSRDARLTRGGGMSS